jgi:DNA-binding CsgD family transcriptional regulator
MKVEIDFELRQLASARCEFGDFAAVARFAEQLFEAASLLWPVEYNAYGEQPDDAQPEGETYDSAPPENAASSIGGGAAERSLTDNQRAVLLLSRQGLSCKHIAAKSRLSEHTVVNIRCGLRKKGLLEGAASNEA